MAGCVVLWWTRYCISPDRDTLHGAGCPTSIQVQRLGGSVTAWCWILVFSGRFLAKTIRGLRVNVMLMSSLVRIPCLYLTGCSQILEYLNWHIRYLPLAHLFDSLVRAELLPFLQFVELRRTPGGHWACLGSSLLPQHLVLLAELLSPGLVVVVVRAALVVAGFPLLFLLFRWHRSE